MSRASAYDSNRGHPRFRHLRAHSRKFEPRLYEPESGHSERFDPHPVRRATERSKPRGLNAILFDQNRYNDSIE